MFVRPAPKLTYVQYPTSSSPSSIFMPYPPPSARRTAAAPSPPRAPGAAAVARAPLRVHQSIALMCEDRSKHVGPRPPVHKTDRLTQSFMHSSTKHSTTHTHAPSVTTSSRSGVAGAACGGGAYISSRLTPSRLSAFWSGGVGGSWWGCGVSTVGEKAAPRYWSQRTDSPQNHVALIMNDPHHTILLPTHHAQLARSPGAAPCSG